MLYTIPMELFERADNSGSEPLAHRMRPRTLDEFVGQNHIVGIGRLLRRVIQADQLASLIFYGPPGTGKTTLARVIANSTKSHFITMNAVLSGVKDLRIAIEEAKEHRDLYDRRTLLFVDEVHRWNKAQQDALLPWVETGTVILIGATTQNPFFEVNSALVSRSRIFRLEPLTDEDLESIARAALSDDTRGYGRYDVFIEEDAIAHLVAVANGDARSLLNALELAVETTPAVFPPTDGESIHVTLEIAEESIQRKVVLYDKEGDYHFDTISAFIKSIRGSDPDAALYWMSRMIYGGEDPRYIFRRMLISAAEDVGLADPAAISVVGTAANAFDRVGMPEGQFFLSEAALYLATAPKSNSTLAFFDALKAVEEEQSADIPAHLKDSNRDGAGFGHGEGYLYPHAYRDHWVAQDYLPDSFKGRVFYEPGDQGFEAIRRVDILRRREAQLAASASNDAEAVEILTFSPPNKRREQWFARIVEQRSDTLESVRARVFELASPARHHTVADLNASNGLLLWEAVRRVPEGSVTGIARNHFDQLAHIGSNIPELERPTIVPVSSTLSETIDGMLMTFDRIIGMNVFGLVRAEPSPWVSIRKLLADDGNLILAEFMPAKAQLLADLHAVDRGGKSNDDHRDVEAVARLREAELAIRNGKAFEEYHHDPEAMEKELTDSGFTIVDASTVLFSEQRSLTRDDLMRWLGPESRYGAALTERVESDVLEAVLESLINSTAGKIVEWQRAAHFIRALYSN